MDSKEWFNLRQLYRSRFSNTKMDAAKFSFSRIKQGAGMCLSRAGGVVGVVGAALILLGLLQVVAGTYFMLVLPIFQLGSNLWTGSWSVVCGCVVGGLAWRGRALRRGQVVLVAALSVLLANVANLVILQVGEKQEFLTEDDRRIIVEENMENQLRIALWLTTVVSALGIGVSFLGAQYLFCVVVRGPRLKGRMPVTRSLSDEDLQRRQEPQDSTPTLEDVVALPDPSRSSAWVYNPEDDKGAAPLGPPGLDLLWDCPDGPRRPPAARHASFATARFARVHQRPQRAQSFVVRRDLLLHASEGRPAHPPAPVRCPELPGTRTYPRYAKPNVRRIYRSNSVSDKTLLGEAAVAAAEAGAALSRRFHAGSLDDLDVGPVIEVGMTREMSRSEHTLATCRTSFCTAPSTGDEDEMEEITIPAIHRSASSVQEHQLGGKTVLSSFSPVVCPAPIRLTKQKGPAPPPPRNKPKPPPPPAAAVQGKQGPLGPTKPPDQEIDFSDEDKDSEAACQLAGISDGRAPLLLMEDNNNNNNNNSYYKRPAPQPRTALPPTSPSAEDDGDTTTETPRKPPPPPPPPPTRTTKPSIEATRILRPEIVKPPRPSVANKNLHPVDGGADRPAPAGCRAQGEEAATLRRLEEVLTGILERSGGGPPLRATRSDENLMESLRAVDEEARASRGILKKGPAKPSRYEQEHREALQDSRALLEQLPRGELQRHKIVLRVPSFRTAGCQTEASRPLRRRASCAQTGLGTVPSLREAPTATNNASVSPMTPSSSSSSRSSLMDRSWKKSSPALESSSSSSGYSSPEVSSKAASPSHSGPPSPASSSVGVSDEEERRRRRRGSDANVTVIEVNKSAQTLPRRLPLWRGIDTIPPPRPPKPFRLRALSDAGLLVPVPRRASQLYEDVFGLAALTENVMLLTEAINPVLVHTRGRTNPAAAPSTAFTDSPVSPRVVDVIPKAVHARLWDGRTPYANQPRPALRTHSLSLPRPSPKPRPPPSRFIRRVAEHYHEGRGEEEGVEAAVSPESSTAAYLASLELLASHYRHQALANAKQLQLQQRLLLQQQQQQQQQQTSQDMVETEFFDEEEEEEEMEEEIEVKEKKNSSPPRVFSESYLVSPVKEDSEC